MPEVGLIVVLRREESDAPGAPKAKLGAGAVVDRRVVDDRLSNLNDREYVIVLRKGRRILPSDVSYILEPGIASRVDHAQRLQPSCAGVINPGHIKPTGARVVPDLIAAADFRDHAQHLACPRVHDDRKTRDRRGAT